MCTIKHCTNPVIVYFYFSKKTKLSAQWVRKFRGTDVGELVVMVRCIDEGGVQ